MASAATIPPAFAPLPAFLSYLIPGLGQVYQGRVGKGILFFVCVYGLFFYGMAMGKWSNVYLPDSVDPARPTNMPRVLVNVYNRPQFLGQFWMGIAVWPAIWQYMNFDKNQATGPVFGNWQRTPLYEYREQSIRDNIPQGTPAPIDWPGETLNEMQTNSDKTWDLAWVYTVIAGVLNVMVMYDAYAGPAFLAAAAAKARDPKGEHAAPAPVAS